MKIEIYKKDNDENVYFSYDENKDVILNFENLKNIAKLFLDKKLNNDDITYEINCDSELILYKNTFDDVIKGVLEDTELIHLYGSKKDDSMNN